MKILAISGSRADWGLLQPVLKLLNEDDRFQLQLLITGQHLCPDSGSLQIIEKSNLSVHHSVDLKLPAQVVDGSALRSAMSRAIKGVGSVLDTCNPDLMLVLGDRYEILGAVIAAFLSAVPVAHIAGGDITEGAFDDAIRHSITKMAALHFVTTDIAASRVLQMGEERDRIFMVGSPGIDQIMATPIISKKDFLNTISLKEQKHIFLITLHPATLSLENEKMAQELIAALNNFEKVGLIFTGSNKDPSANMLDQIFMDFVNKRGNSVFQKSLGSQIYFAALNYCDVVIGNSSSGLYEAPSFKTPTVNIGDRQAGRVRAESVFDCRANAAEIQGCIEKALVMDFSEVRNPYGNGDSAHKIVDVLAAIENPSSLIRKRFQDYENVEKKDSNYS